MLVHMPSKNIIEEKNGAENHSKERKKLYPELASRGNSIE